MATPQNTTFDFGSPGTHYVYLYRDPRPGKWLTPIYVGKGAGNRSERHWLYGSHNLILEHTLNSIRKAGLKPTIEIVRWCDSEEEAFTLEKQLIAKYGRRDLKTGPLLNRTDGGDGATSTLVTADTRKKISDAFKRLWSGDSKYAAHLRALRQSKRYRRAQSVAKIGKIASAQTRAKMSASQTARQAANPAQRECHATLLRELRSRPDVEAKRLEAMRKRWADPAKRAAFSEVIKAEWIDPCGKRRLAMRKLAKLSDDDVVDIRTQVASGAVMAHVAAHYGISPQFVAQLARGTKRKDAGGTLSAPRHK